MDKFLQFFSEDNGNLSNMRLNATVLVLVGCFLLCYSLIVSKDITANVIAGSIGIITIGIGGKAIQKKEEV